MNRFFEGITPLLTFKSLIPAALTVASIAHAQAAEIDPRRSLFITDKVILNQFSLNGENGVLKAIAASAGDFSQSPQQLVDTMEASLCNGSSTDFNNLPGGCGTTIRGINTTEAISLVNRFDLAPANGENCGEYRITFSQVNGRNSITTQFVIFEAKLPNPHQELGLEGCRPVMNFWAGLSTEDNINVRAQQLRDFYFTGLNGFGPVISAHNYQGESVTPISGQIRINNRISTPDVWSFSEFNSRINGNTVELVQTTVKETPFADLSSDTSLFPVQAQAFQDAVVNAVSIKGKGLLANTMSTLNIDIPAEAEVGRQGIVLRAALAESIFSGAVNGQPGGHLPSRQELNDAFNENTSGFAQRIQQQLRTANSNLTPAQVLSRVAVLTCVGCHSSADDLGNGLEHVGPASDLLEMHSLRLESDITPVRIEAENFIMQSGIETETTTDVGGGLNVGFVDANDWMIFDVALPPSIDNRYIISYRTAKNVFPGGNIQLEQPGGGVIYDSFSVSFTGGWQNWRTIERTVTLPAGITQLAISTQSGNWNLNWFEIKPAGADRFIIKPPVLTEFLPERKVIMEDFLNTASCTDSSCLDSDNDGVNDNLDLCPNTPAGTTVNASGCEEPTGGSCNGVAVYPTWLHNDYDGGPNTHLLGGELMQHNNQLFQANWYTSSLPGSDATWTSLGSCD